MNKVLIGTATVGAVAVYAIVRSMTAKKQQWGISYGNNGWAIHLDEVPAWADLAESALDELPCFHVNHDLWYKVGFGQVEDDPTDYPKYSIGSALFDLCQVRHRITWYAGEETVMRVPITDEQAQEIAPEFYQDMNPDQMIVTFENDERSTS
jgi:hypothetical protein